MREESKRSLLDSGWSYGLFDCFGDCSTCCYGSFCSSCAAGEIWEQGGLGNDTKWDWSIGCCIYCAIINPCWCVYGALFTEKLREQEGIDGSRCKDCMEGTFCLCCAHVRNLREVREE